MPSMSLRQGLNENIKNLHRGAFAHSKPNIVQLFSEGGQPMSLKEQAGLIQGPGTGKSDSIDAKLPVKGFVLPIEVVQAIGPDKLQAMIDQFRGDSPNMDSEQVPAKVSNGEFFVPPEVVAKTGPEYWDSLVQQVTGKPAQPEISQEGVKAQDGYTPTSLKEAAQSAQQFWKNAPNQPVPIPGRANPPNPADLMKDRLAASASAMQVQGQDLRAKMDANRINSLQTQTAPPAVQPASLKAQAQPARQSAASYFNAPKTPALKDQVASVGNDMAVATGLAYDVLNAPEIAKGRDEAISGLKARAGFSPDATPFRYAEGGYVDPEEERRKNPQSLKAFAQPPSVNSPQRPLYDYAESYRGMPAVPAVGKAISDYGNALAEGGQKLAQRVAGANEGYRNFLYGEGNPTLAEQALEQAKTVSPTKPVAAEQPSSLKAAVFNPDQDKPKVTQANTVNTPSLKESVKAMPADPTTGFRYDGAPQTLDWNESRWSNSGDVAQDAALADRQAARSAMRDQVDLTQPEVQSEFTKTKDGFSRSSRFGGVKPDYPTTGGQSALGLAKLAQDQAQFDKIYSLKEQEANKNMPEELGDDAYSAIDDIKKGDMTGAVYMMQRYPKTLKVLRETYPDLFSNFGLTNG
jgi:hypothetical protein